MSFSLTLIVPTIQDVEKIAALGYEIFKFYKIDMPYHPTAAPPPDDDGVAARSAAPNETKRSTRTSDQSQSIRNIILKALKNAQDVGMSSEELKVTVVSFGYQESSTSTALSRLHKRGDIFRGGAGWVSRRYRQKPYRFTNQFRHPSGKKAQDLILDFMLEREGRTLYSDLEKYMVKEGFAPGVTGATLSKMGQEGIVRRLNPGVYEISPQQQKPEEQ